MKSSTSEGIYIILDGIEGIQEYIARDVNNIALVERAIQYYYYYSYRALCVIVLSNDRG